MTAPQPPGRADRGSALIAAAIVAASLIVYWGMPGSAPHYQIAASGASVMRLDTDSGEIIACDARQCLRVTEPDRAKTLKLFTGGGKPQPALPPSSNSS